VICDRENGSNVQLRVTVVKTRLGSDRKGDTERKSGNREGDSDRKTTATKMVTVTKENIPVLTNGAY
jgi:hypothetical protein